MVDVPKLEAYHFHERAYDSYDALLSDFEWEIPDEFNIADYVCDRWADGEQRVAIYAEDAAGTTTQHTFSELNEITNSLAGYFDERGVERGDRICINSPQKPETLMAHVAAWKVGATTVPLSTLFGPSAVEYRLDDSGATVVVVDESNLDAFREVDCDVDTVVTIGSDEAGDDVEFWSAVERGPSSYDNAVTAAEDDAMILYTSGTTGDPKGVLHAHRILLGFLPAIVTTIGNMEITDYDVFWSPSEWTWIGTLFLVVFPPLFYGQPALAYESEQFDPETAFKLIDRYEVTNLFAPPTALRMMMQVDDATERYDGSSVRAVTSGGEALGSSIVEWVDETFDGVPVNDWYGQTEADPIATGCGALMEYRQGKIGKAAPGVEVEIVDPDDPDVTVDSGELGEIAVDHEASKPVCFKEYWNKPDETSDKLRSGWLLTEDLGRKDEDGYVAFHSRRDDVIISAGYRISPEEVEDHLTQHRSVVDAGVIGVPDDTRGEVPKAFVVLSGDATPPESLESELQRHVKDRLAKYEYPREVKFVAELPKTSTGKIQRSALRQRES